MYLIIIITVALAIIGIFVELLFGWHVIVAKIKSAKESKVKEKYLNVTKNERKFPMSKYPEIDDESLWRSVSIGGEKYDDSLNDYISRNVKDDGMKEYLAREAKRSKEQQIQQDLYKNFK